MKYLLRVILLAATVLAMRPALASEPSEWGLALQVNEGAPQPPTSVLAATAPPGSTIRDSLGWHEVELSRGAYNIPAADWALYQQVAAIGDKNVITLFAGNPIYGTATFGFPVTDEQIQAWANFAAYVVRQDGGTKPDATAANVPSLEAVTIWNEFNGAFNGGIVNLKDRQAAMAKLLKVVVPAIRAANPNVKIAAGAYVGAPNLATWFEHIQEDGFNWHNVDWLDIHPYVGPASALTWKNQVHDLRAAGITNPFYFSEWGGPVAANYLVKFAGTLDYPPTYMQWFIANVIGVDPVPPAGGNFFTLSSTKTFVGEGLTNGTMALPGYQLTRSGADYLQIFVPWAASTQGN